MTAERDTLAALLHVETVGCNHVAPAACDPRPGGGKDDRHMAQADRLIAAGVRVAPSPESKYGGGEAWESDPDIGIDAYALSPGRKERLLALTDVTGDPLADHDWQEAIRAVLDD